VWHGELGARAYTGGLAEPPAGSRGRAPGQGVRGEAPKSWSFFKPCTTKGDRKFVKFRTLSWVRRPTSLITAWCRQLNWRRQSFQLEGNCMFNCRSAFSWFSSILNGDNGKLKFVKNNVRSMGGSWTPLPPLRTPLGSHVHSFKMIITWKRCKMRRCS